MRSLVPTTLWGRVLLVILTGLAVAHAASIAFVTFERAWTFERIQAHAIAEQLDYYLRLKNLPEHGAPIPLHSGPFVYEDTTPGTVVGIAAHTGPPFGWRVVEELEAPGDDESPAPRVLGREIRKGLESRVGYDPVVRMTMREAPLPYSGSARMGVVSDFRANVRRELREGRGRPPPKVNLVTVALKLPDSRFAVADVHFFQPPAHIPIESWMSVALIFLVTTAFSIWAARLAVKPVRSLASAADRLSRNIDEPPMPVSGAVEIPATPHTPSTGSRTA